MEFLAHIFLDCVVLADASEVEGSSNYVLVSLGHREAILLLVSVFVIDFESDCTHEARVQYVIQCPSDVQILPYFGIDLARLMDSQPFTREVLSLQHSDEDRSQFNLGLTVILPFRQILLVFVVVVESVLFGFLLGCVHFELVDPHLSLVLDRQVLVAAHLKAHSLVESHKIQGTFLEHVLVTIE